MRRVVMFSGGIGSWAAAKRVVERHGAQDVTLLFTDTKMEDKDLYRFLDEAAADVFRNMTPNLVRLCEGRTPWEVFFDERFLGNSKVDPCSKILKRKMKDRWLTENCDPADTIAYVGIDWTEMHRFDDGAGGGLRPRRAAAGWKYEAPMCEPPYMDKQDMLRALKACGIKAPRLYDMGFSHNNCGGFCCKAGQGHFANLYRQLPETYAYHEQKEQDIIAYLEKPVSMLTEQIDGISYPLTLKTLRERIDADGQIDMYEIGGCGCFIDEPEETKGGDNG